MEDILLTSIGMIIVLIPLRGIFGNMPVESITSAQQGGVTSSVCYEEAGMRQCGIKYPSVLPNSMACA